jgi:hypothetical protein
MVILIPYKAPETVKKIKASIE